MRIWNLVLKEFIQFRRDWLMTTFIITLPILQLVLLAQATGSRISNLHVAVLNHDRSSASRRLVTALDNRRELAVRHYLATLADTHRCLDQGEATVVVIIPAGFAADMADVSRTPQVQLIADASNNIPALVAISAARGAIAAFVRETGFFGKNPVSTIDLRTTVCFNPTFNHKFFTVPAQVGFIVYQVTLTVASIGLARERELGTLEQLMVMPLRRIELVIGKAIPALVIGALNFLSMLAIAVFGFHVPLRGSLLLLFALTLLFIVAEIGYGMLISSIARTQQQAILLVFVLAMVDMTFSGYLVRVKNLPVALLAIAQVVPFRHYLTIIRGVMLKGAGLDTLWPHAAAMLLMGLLVTAVAVRNLSRSLD
ncbi:MAG: ABC transporter permease [Chloroflexi bacterium]|nr:ABC transporter permease [Chloroflexota bacterium]